jgi:Suppressor of fused protein (SUFU)
MNFGAGVLTAVTRHIERHVGAIDFALHETHSHLVHVDVHHVPPRNGRKFHTLVTSGMSERAMPVPEWASHLAYSELFLLLPPEWDVSIGWPVRLLRELARYPHERETWLGCGHTVRNRKSAGPFASGLPFCAVLLAHPVTLGAEFSELRLRTRSIHFYQVVPLHREEIGFALRYGADALLARFAQYQMSDIADPLRANAIRERSSRAAPGAERGTRRP